MIALLIILLAAGIVLPIALTVICACTLAGECDEQQERTLKEQA